jgi:hypothetical protein
VGTSYASTYSIASAHERMCLWQSPRGYSFEISLEILILAEGMLLLLAMHAMIVILFIITYVLLLTLCFYRVAMSASIASVYIKRYFMKHRLSVRLKRDFAMLDYLFTRGVSLGTYNSVESKLSFLRLDLDCCIDLSDARHGLH